MVNRGQNSMWTSFCNMHKKEITSHTVWQCQYCSHARLYSWMLYYKEDSQVPSLQSPKESPTLRINNACCSKTMANIEEKLQSSAEKLKKWPDTRAATCAQYLYVFIEKGIKFQTWSSMKKKKRKNMATESLEMQPCWLWSESFNMNPLIIFY